MPSFKFSSVRIDSAAVHLPTREVTSASLEERIAPLYQRLGVPFGTLERLSGVRSRFLWDAEVMPSQVATVAAEKALAKMSFPREELGTLFNCSVARDYFEPATACLVHRNLGLPEEVMAMDISNACVGFSNGILTLATMIERGIVRAGVVVSGESITRIIEASAARLMRDESVGREELLKILPTFTLGCGAVAYVLAHESLSPHGHKLVGGVARSATEFNDLCNGNEDFCLSLGKEIQPIMHTESALLISSAAKLGGRMWREASEVMEWSTESLNHIFCHQVGRQVNEGFYREMGLPMEKEFTIYRTHGNLVSAALPTALVLGSEERGIKSGERVLWTGFGSGLNSVFLGIEW